MGRAIRFGIGMPQAQASGQFDPAAIRDYLAQAEALGFDSLWVQENFFGAMPQLAPLELLTFAAACTQRLRLGCAVFLTALRSPVAFAKSIASADQLSGGRLIVGVGLGWPERSEGFGIDPATRLARFTEGLRLTKALWTEPTVHFQGRFWQVDGARLEPKPVQKPYPPLWFGGSHPHALRRAVRLGDGFIGAGIVSTAQFANQVRALGELLEAEGRDPSSFPLSKRVYIHVDDDRERAASRVSAWFGAYYGPRGAPPCIWGPPPECAAAIGEVAEAGAGLIVLTPVCDYAEQLQRLAREVVPRVTATVEQGHVA